jgi:hypothetical protein
LGVDLLDVALTGDRFGLRGRVWLARICVPAGTVFGHLPENCSHGGEDFSGTPVRSGDHGREDDRGELENIPPFAPPFLWQGALSPPGIRVAPGPSRSSVIFVLAGESGSASERDPTSRCRVSGGYLTQNPVAPAF